MFHIASYINGDEPQSNVSTNFTARRINLSEHLGHPKKWHHNHTNIPHRRKVTVYCWNPKFHSIIYTKCHWSSVEKSSSNKHECVPNKFWKTQVLTKFIRYCIKLLIYLIQVSYKQELPIWLVGNLANFRWPMSKIHYQLIMKQVSTWLDWRRKINHVKQHFNLWNISLKQNQGKVNQLSPVWQDSITLHITFKLLKTALYHNSQLAENNLASTLFSQKIVHSRAFDYCMQLLIQSLSSNLVKSSFSRDSDIRCTTNNKIKAKTRRHKLTPFQQNDEIGTGTEKENHKANVTRAMWPSLGWENWRTEKWKTIYWSETVRVINLKRRLLVIYKYTTGHQLKRIG